MAQEELPARLQIKVEQGSLLSDLGSKEITTNQKILKAVVHQVHHLVQALARHQFHSPETRALVAAEGEALKPVKLKKAVAGREIQPLNNIRVEAVRRIQAL
jgi:hypothetical protein